MKSSKRCFGCDLGTTNSALSVYIGDNASQIIKFENGKTTMPSCVKLNNDGSLTVGEEAFSVRYLDSVAYSVKKYMGTDKIITLTAENGTTRDFKPEEIGAEVIKEMVKRASYLYPDIKDICITVPAAFGNRQREATRRAGELAGLNVVSIINEPTSATLCYNVSQTEDIMVYDLGGGTFDTTILRAEVPEVSSSSSDLNFAGLGIDLTSEISSGSLEPMFTVLTTKGNPALGGDDIDEYMLRIALSRLNEKIKSVGLKGDYTDYLVDNYADYLQLTLEETKRGIHANPGSSLSIDEIESEFFLPGKEQVFKSALKGMTLITITYADLVKATKAIFDKTKTLVNRALSSGSVNRNNIHKIILVGGSTENEILRDLLRNTYKDCEINTAFKPYEIVAQGASIQAAISCNMSSVNLTDVVPYTIGVGTIEKEDFKEVEGSNRRARQMHKVSPIIKKDTKLPVMRKCSFKVNNKSNTLGVKIYQGDGVLAEDCELIGEVFIDREYQSETANLIIKIDTNGILDFQVDAGNATKKVQLMNIFGSNAGNGKKVSTFLKFSRRWRESLLAAGVTIEGDLALAFKKYETNGDKESKTFILNELKKVTEEDLNKTKFFNK